jgi:amidase
MGNSIALTYQSAAQLASLIRTRQISATEVVEACIDRQMAVNDALNAIVMNCYSRARAEAKRLDAQLAKGNLKGILHGVPMTLKDSIDTEGVVTTGGTFGRQQHVPNKDATVAARLRNAGAILLGKTNTPEFTLGYLAGANTTGNLLHGSSHNPYDLTRSTSGSSGGAGAAVAAGLAAFDVGSAFGGSIRGPAHVNGISAIVPTSVRVPRTGHIIGYGGMFDSWQQLGPMARRVEDLALITPLIIGPDLRDPACAPVPWPDPMQVDLRGLRVAFCTDNGGAATHATDEDTKSTVMRAARWLEEVVGNVEENAPAAILCKLDEARRLLLDCDGWQFYQRLADRWDTRSISPWARAVMDATPPLSLRETVMAWENHAAARAQMIEWMQGFDVFLCPALPKPAQPIDQPRPTTGAHSVGAGWSYTGVFSSLGWPVVVVRCGSSADGRLPIGLQVVARPWREDVCIAVAGYLEERSGGWKSPPINNVSFDVAPNGRELSGSASHR